MKSLDETHIRTNPPKGDTPKVLSVISRIFRPTLTLNQEAPSDELDAPDATTVDAAQELETTKTNISEMSTVAVPVQSVASAVSSTNNSISLVD